MKKILILPVAVLLAAAVCTSCNKRDKISERVSVWDDGSDTASVGIKLSSDKIVIPFVRTDGDLAQIQVSMNGVPFNMLWDTGASITQISALELQKLAKEDKISLNDYQSTIVTKIANGDTVASLVFNIKEIYIQGRDNQYLVLNDIDAVVSDNKNAPLLLGQNVIQRLPRHVFNEEKGVIEFEKPQ